MRHISSRTSCASRAPRLLAVSLALALATGCDDRAVRDGDKSTSRASSAPSAKSAPSASSVIDSGKPQLDPDLVKMARDARDAASTVASVCVISSEGYELPDFYDSCLFPKEDAARLHQKTAALASSALVPETGPAASFVAELRMFDAFVANADTRHQDEYTSDIGRLYRSRGTLSHYQDLAAAWNAMVPEEPTPLDVGKLPHAFDAGVHGTIRWARCGGLACFRDRGP